MTTMARVSDVAEQIRGVTYDKTLASNEPSEGRFPILRAGNIRGEGLDFRDLVYLPKSSISPKQLIKKGDVVIATSSGSLDVVGKAAQAENDFQGGFGAFCKVLRPGPVVDPRYFGHFFRTPEYRSHVSRLAAGANINNLRMEHLGDLILPLPPIEDQRRIAKVLDQADELLAKRRQTITLLDDLAQTIFLDMFGNPAINPKGWEIRTVGDLIESATYGSSQKAHMTGDFPVLRMGNLTAQGRIDLSDLKYLPKSEVGERHIVRKGDVLFNRTNSADLVGKTAVFRESVPMAYAGYLVRVRANPQNHPEYISAFLNSGYGKKILRNMCKSIIGMANINARELQSIRIPAAPLELQQEFARRLQATERQRAAHLSHLEALDELFTSLQAKAFRGEL